MATWYISTTGNDAAAGTSDAPWAITALNSTSKYQAGDTIILKNGTYTPSSYILLSETGSSGNIITIKSETKWGAVLDFTNVTGNHSIQFNNTISYITIDGLEIKNSPGVVVAIFASVNGNNTYITIIRNKIHHIGNTVSDNDYGIAAVFAGIGAHHWTIDSNVMHDIGRLGGTGLGVWDFDSGMGGDGKKDHPLYLELYSSVIKNNVFYNVDTGPFRGWPISFTDAGNPLNNKDLQVLNNTFYGPTVNTAYCVGHINFCCFQSKANNIIANNISYEPVVALVQDMYSGVASNCIIRNNLCTKSMLYCDSSSPNANNFTQTGNISNYSTSYPLFTNAAGYDFSLDANATAAINSAYLSDLPSLDITGATRPLPVGSNGDLGAYELDEDPITPPDPPAGNEITGLAQDGGVVDTYSNSERSSTAGIRIDNYSRRGQTFVGDGTYLSSAEFFLQKVGTPTGSLYAKLYATSAGMPTGSAVATSEAIDPTTVPTSFTNTVFTFSTPYLLVNETTYFISCEITGGDISNNILVGIDNTDASHSGEGRAYATEWVDQPGIDTCFSVNGHTYAYTYEVALTTEPYMVSEDGVYLTEQASIANVDANAGSWYWSTNVVYIRPTTGVAGDHTYLWQPAPQENIASFPFDEGSGTTITDTVNALVGTINNGSWGTWKGVDVVKFNGSTTNIVLPASVYTNGLTEFTYTAWIHPLSISLYPRIFTKESEAIPAAFMLCIGDDGYIGASILDATTQYISNGNCPLARLINRWSFLAVTYDNTGDKKLHIYHNGQEISYVRHEAVAGVVATNSNNIYMGNNWNNTRPFHGKMTKVNIYNVALTAGEVATAYGAEWAEIDRIYHTLRLPH